VQERGGNRLLVEPELGADLGGAEGMVDELLARAALLTVVRLGGELEGTANQIPIDLRVVGRHVGEQLLDEVLVPLKGVDNGHLLSVLSARALTDESPLPRWGAR